jgi:hypothetical protein
VAVAELVAHPFLAMRGEIEQEQAAAGSEDAVRLAERRSGVGQKVQRLGENGHVHAGVGEGEALEPAAPETHA